MLKIHRNFYIFLLVGTILCSCENNIDVVKLFTSPEKMPDVSMYNVETIYSDSAKTKGRLTAPVLNRFDRAEKKYSEFPKGLHIYFYNDSMHVNAEVSANYGIFRDVKEIFEARNNVVVVNTKGEKLHTEQLFWDQKKGIIYTQKYCRITTPDGLQHIGEHGMEAKENFDDWTLFGSSGTIDIKNAAE
jgi:LPS export ABC transporter protein LptC